MKTEKEVVDLIERIVKNSKDILETGLPIVDPQKALMQLFEVTKAVAKLDVLYWVVEKERHTFKGGW